MDRIFFLGIISADGCNPNGDPAASNLPRTLVDGRGEISDVSIKRKVRDTLCFSGEDIFVRSDITRDQYKSQKDRAGQISAKTVDEFAEAACRKWIDTRIFGQVFHLPAKVKGNYGDAVSIGVRGPITVSSALSIAPVVSVDEVIADAEDVIPPERWGAKSRMTFGRKPKVWQAAYVFTGGVSPQLASLTGASEADVTAFRTALLDMYNNTGSASRPDGTIVLDRLYWWTMHKSASPAKILRAVHISPAQEWPYYTITVDPVENTEMEVFA